jgi:uncharacterized protein
MEIVVARTFLARMRGLALRRRPPPGRVLLLPRCRSVHTFGMRFVLDLVWLDGDGRVIALDQSVPPNRVRTRREAAAVIEVPAGSAELPRPSARLPGAAALE